MIFDRIVCGVDGSPAGFEALGQATRVRADAARILALAVCPPNLGARTDAAASSLNGERSERVG